MIYLLDRNQIISHPVNRSEIHPALSEIAKFISLSIVRLRKQFCLDFDAYFNYMDKFYFL